MADAQQLRCFLLQEQEALIQLKQNRDRELYRGFLPESILRNKDVHAYATNQVQAWLKAERQIAVISSGTNLAGYIVYGPENRESRVGLIHEVGWNEELGPEMKRHMVIWALKELEDMGMEQEEVWILRHNLSGRFLFESMGFRCLHEKKMIQKLNQEFEYVRYRYKQDA